MSNPFLGEIRLFGGNFPPRGWAFCNGQLLSIAANSALYSLIGTIYGGDGMTTFGVPDLRGRVPVGQGQGPGLSARVVGQLSGSETVTLTAAQMPQHTHQPRAFSSAGTQASPANGTWAATAPPPGYSSGTPGAAMNAAAIGSAGGGQPHDNMIPFLGLSFIIATEGIYPSRN
ncbi:MAG: tail fiber protein [Vicinamibacteria bacterium]|nr:tail fiber protein [Vicinamibacteria bacterium]